MPTSKIFFKKSDEVLIQDSFEKESKIINEKLVKRKQRIEEICQILVMRR